MSTVVLVITVNYGAFHLQLLNVSALYICHFYTLISPSVQDIQTIPQSTIPLPRVRASIPTPFFQLHVYTPAINERIPCLIFRANTTQEHFRHHRRRHPLIGRQVLYWIAARVLHAF